MICRVTFTKHSRVTFAQQGMPALHLALSLRCSLSTRNAALSIIGHMLAGPLFDPNLRDAALSPPLCTAAAAADAEAIDALIKAGADPTFRDAHGCTPLHLALMSGSAAAIALLLPYISPLQQNSDGASCEHLIASLPPSFGVPLPSPPSALADAAGMTAAAAAAAALSPSAASEGPSFLFYDSAATRLHVAEVSFCTEAAARVDVLAGESGVLLDAASRGSATVISEMPPASLPDLARCHAWSYLSRIRELSQSCGTSQPFVSIDADTMISSGSWEAARRSAGGVCAAVDAVLGRKGLYYDGRQTRDENDRQNAFSDASSCAARGRAFVVARPPGHHCG